MRMLRKQTNQKDNEQYPHHNTIIANEQRILRLQEIPQFLRHTIIKLGNRI